MKPILANLALLGLLLLPSSLMAIPSDLDNDGLRDAVETNTGVFVSETSTGTNPNLADTDGDSMPDGMEVNIGTNPVLSASKVKRPNIIYILADDLGYGDVGCFWQNQRTGIWKFATPQLDKMASEGAMLTHNYVAAPICVSSRSSFLQGRSQGHADVRDGQFDSPLPNTYLLADILRKSGYSTTHIGKAGLAGRDPANPTAHPLARGFDYFFGSLTHDEGHEHYPRNGTTSLKSNIYMNNNRVSDAYVDLYTSDAWTGFAKKRIIEETTNHPERPFFIFLSYDTPHFYGQTPPTRDYPTGGGLAGGIQWTGAPSYVSTAVNDPTRVNNLANFHPSVHPNWYPNAKHFVTMVRRMDDSVADLLKTLRDLNIDDNTLVVFTSDNGPSPIGYDPRSFGSHAGFEGIKGDLLEGGIRVPTITWWPSAIPASNDLANIRKIDRPCANYDWLATFAELAKAPVPSFSDGTSLVPTLISTGTQLDKGFLYFEMNSYGPTADYPEFINHRNDPRDNMQAVRIGDFMGLRTAITHSDNPFRIYNVVSDPKQATNVAPSRPDLQQQMKRLAIGARRPLASTYRPYNSSNIPPYIPTTPIKGGLKWKSYQGYWPWLPELRMLTPTTSGETASITTEVRSRNEDFGLSYEGYLSVETTGAYTFQIASDSGASLWLHESHVIDNDVAQSPTKSSGPVYLSAGLHPIRLYYRHQAGSITLDLKYSGPGISLQNIPASRFFTDGPSPVFNLQPDTSITKLNQPVLVDALANDSCNYPITLASAGNSSSGTASINGGAILFTPTPGFFGSATFPYTVSTGVTTATSAVTMHVLSDNEVWIPCDEGAGSSVSGDSHLSYCLGTLAGTSTPDASWIKGNSGKALRFDGDNDQVNFPGLELPSGSSPRTFSCWMRTSNTLSGEIQTLFSYGGQSAGGLFAVRVHNIPGVAGNHPARLEVFNGTVIGTKPLNDGLWHHVAIVLEDTNNNSSLNVAETKIYVDGVADEITITIPMVINTGNALIPSVGGSNHATNHHFNGDIDDIRVFPEALTALEIANLRGSAANFVIGPQDVDGDGASATEEAIAGTNPDDPASVFRIKSTAYAGQNFVIRWSAIADKTYVVEESASMNSWTPVPNLAPYVAVTDNPDATILIPVSSQPNRFYRLSVK